MNDPVKDTIHIDGRQGEGGGQVLRTSLSLAAALGRPVRITDVRGGRRKPGLLRQHRTALRALVDITGGAAEHDELGSREVTFRPGGPPRGGEYRFGIGSAGSTMLVLQTILPVLLRAEGESTVVLEGGTHNPAAPPFEAFAEAFLPCLRAAGAAVDIELERPGYFPAGGGEVRVRVSPVTDARPLEILEHEPAGDPTCEVHLQNLPDRIGEREWREFQKRVHWPSERFTLRQQAGGRGPGNVMLARVPAATHTTVHAAFGLRDLPSEVVAGKLAGRVRSFERAGAPVDESLADQLMLPLALMAGGVYRCERVTEHARTNAGVIGLFLPGAVRIEGESVEARSTARIEVSASGA